MNGYVNHLEEGVRTLAALAIIGGLVVVCLVNAVVSLHQRVDKLEKEARKQP